jgi:hypothetical protein
VDAWWHRDVIAAGKLPLFLCFLAFVVTFAVTRTITRLIRAGRGPFRDRVTASGTHVHHAVPGIALLITGAITAITANSTLWGCVAAVLIGVGVSLVLDEFALILHLTDVYWSGEGRLSVDMVSLAAACLGLVLIGFSPVGVEDVGSAELAVRLTGVTFVVVHFVLILVCLLKGKYTISLIGLFLTPVALVGAVRIARPTSWWARHRYREGRMARAERRSAEIDRRYLPLLRRWQNLVGGAPSRPDPAPATAAPASAGSDNANPGGP